MKLKRENILSNPHRKRIYKFIMNNPGIQFNQIVKTLDMNISLVEWHLSVLMKFDFIKRKKMDNHDAYFHLNIEPEHFKILHLISREKCKEIINHLRINNAGITKNRLSGELGMHPYTIKKYVKKLEKNKLLLRKNLSNKTLYFLDETKYERYKRALTKQNSEIFQTASFPLPKKDYNMRIGKNGNGTWKVHIYEGETLISTGIFSKLSMKSIQWFVLQALNYPLMNPVKLEHVLRLAFYCALNEIAEPIKQITPEIERKTKGSRHARVKGLSFQEKENLFKKYCLNRAIIPYIFPVLFSNGMLPSVFKIVGNTGYAGFPSVIFFTSFIFVLVYFLPLLLVFLVSLRYSKMFPRDLSNKLILDLKENFDSMYEHWLEDYSKYQYFIGLTIPVPFSLCFFISDLHQFLSLLFLDALIAAFTGTLVTIKIARRYVECGVTPDLEVFRRKKMRRYLFTIAALFLAIISLIIQGEFVIDGFPNNLFLEFLLNYSCFCSWSMAILLISRNSPLKNQVIRRKSEYSFKEVLSLYKDSIQKLRDKGVKRAYLTRKFPPIQGVKRKDSPDDHTWEQMT